MFRLFRALAIRDCQKFLAQSRPVENAAADRLPAKVGRFNDGKLFQINGLFRLLF